MYGKDLTLKLCRLIVYDLRKSILGLMQPLGYVIVPKLQDPNYQKMPESAWSQYRLDNKYKLHRPDFDSMIEEMYEIKKDKWIAQEQGRETGFHHEERFKLGVWLRSQPVFIEAGNKKKQRIMARQIFRDLTESEIDDIVEIARMDIGLNELDTMRKEHQKDERGEAEAADKEEEPEEPAWQTKADKEEAERSGMDIELVQQERREVEKKIKEEEEEAYDEGEFSEKDQGENTGKPEQEQQVKPDEIPLQRNKPDKPISD